MREGKKEKKNIFIQYFSLFNIFHYVTFNSNTNNIRLREQSDSKSMFELNIKSRYIVRTKYFTIQYILLIYRKIHRRYSKMSVKEHKKVNMFNIYSIFQANYMYQCLYSQYNVSSELWKYIGLSGRYLNHLLINWIVDK